ncbi:MAG: spore cortex-lytic enzyme [Eubacteriales bacterium]|jgi:N-acetylmuramoyl-L-alanine amidase
MRRKWIQVLQAVVLLTLTLLLAAGCQQAQQDAVETAVITLGSRGETVRVIQKKLTNWGYFNGTIDGIYGEQTRKAVIYFQQKNGLQADGVVGPKTLAALGIQEDGSAQTGGTQSVSASDRNLLARVINGEARGEPFTGQVAVGAVILNRVEHPSFPNTIAGVVYQPLAFTAVADGQIDAEMEESCYRAADMALSGADPSGGAIYYYNPKTATSQWIYSRPVIKTIGSHVFAK